MDVDIYEPACDSEDVYIDDYHLISNDGSNCVNLHTYINTKINAINKVLHDIETEDFHRGLTNMDDVTKHRISKSKKRSLTQRLKNLKNIQNDGKAIIRLIKKEIETEKIPAGFLGFMPKGVSKTYFDTTVIKKDL